MYRSFCIGCTLNAHARCPSMSFGPSSQPYNVSVASEVAACAALTNMKYLDTVSGGIQCRGGSRRHASEWEQAA